MSEDKNWQFELEEYIQQGEPERTQKSEAWQTAIGLQDVDGLQTSAYLLDTAREHIEGKISIGEAQKRIESYYEESTERLEIESKTKEGDIVSARIAMLLGERTFQFSPAEFLAIHGRLFKGIFVHAGQIRPYNITKREWVLKGDTVIYAPCNSIKATLDYDFSTEKQFSYENLSLAESVNHLAKFASDIWQIHPFCEGNTRATGVFIIKYMSTFGLEVSNDVFARHSWYFRNALVRANYNDLKNGIYATRRYLEQFFSNMLMGTGYELKNRLMHLDYDPDFKAAQIKSEIKKGPKGKKFPLNFSLEELAILKLIALDPTITQKEIAEKVGKTDRTVKNKMAKMQKENYIRRINGKRNGKWEILIELPII